MASTRAAGRPVSAPPPPPPGITPIGDPWRSAPGQPPQSGSGQVPVPTPRPAPGVPPRGSRSEWATHATAPGPRDAAATNGREPPTGRVAPPWRADDLRPPEPPVLRLVEPTLPEELRDDLGYPAPSEPPSLRLVGSRGNGAPLSVPPVSADDDDTLLIFAETRSAWFTQEADAAFDSAMDVGWQAAEQAAHPTVGDRTTTGLPRRVPRANLVPGAPPGQDEPVRVVRDPAAIAAHTSGYFNGWRRGQEVGGYPLRGRQSRPGGGWEFHREEDRLSG